MSSDQQDRRGAQDDQSMDDIEILEVVGVDENGAVVDDEASEDVEVLFDDAGTAEAPSEPAEAPAPPREDAQLRERLLRLQADFENFKKRIERERLDHFRYATSDLLARLLPVLDNFERAIASVRPGVGADAVIEGIGLIQRQLLQELEREGLRAMESVGQPFDPELHEAVGTDSEAPVPAHTVTQVLQRGYFLHDRVLRPAMVRVRVESFDDADGPGHSKES